MLIVQVQYYEYPIRVDGFSNYLMLALATKKRVQYYYYSTVAIPMGNK
jgi:hypothetical protein